VEWNEENEMSDRWKALIDHENGQVLLEPEMAAMIKYIGTASYDLYKRITEAEEKLALHALPTPALKKLSRLISDELILRDAAKA
jgi:hypothetical protein